jgi:hypothetical protein
VGANDQPLFVRNALLMNALGASTGLVFVLVGAAGLITKGFEWGYLTAIVFGAALIGFFASVLRDRYPLLVADAEGIRTPDEMVPWAEVAYIAHEVVPGEGAPGHLLRIERADPLAEVVTVDLTGVTPSPRRVFASLAHRLAETRPDARLERQDDALLRSVAVRAD